MSPTRPRSIDHGDITPDHGETLGLRHGLDLRLVPAALAVWAVTAGLLAAGDPVYGWATAAAAAIATVPAWRAGTWHWAVPAITVASSAAGVAIRRTAAAAHEVTSAIGAATTVDLRLTSAPARTDYGAAATAAIDGLPGRVTVFGDAGLMAHDTGTRLTAVAAVRESGRPSLSGLTLTLRGDPIAANPADGPAARVRAGLADIAAGLPDGPGRLIPAMVLGDERAFSPGYQDMMATAGLAHLTAVSGANVALVTGAAVALVAWAPPLVRVSAGAAALAGVIAIAGTEASVLRAGLTGAIGLLAVATGRRHQAVPALAGGCLILLIAHPGLAVSAGFALSVAATAAIVLGAVPAAHRLLRVPGVRTWPAPVVRAVAVTLIAHVATAPVLALTVGEVSHVSVAANLLAAPAVAPVTILGTAAAVALLIGAGPAATILVHAAAPFAWWVDQIGRLAAAIPGAATEMGATGAAAIMVVAIAAWRHPAPAAAAAVAVTVVAGAVIATGAHLPGAPAGWVALVCPVSDGPGQVAVVTPATRGNAGDFGRACAKAAAHDPAAGEAVTGVAGELDAATGTPGDWVAVADCGERARRTIRTPDGRPVACPVRDGPVALYPGGRLWAAEMARWDP